MAVDTSLNGAPRLRGGSDLPRFCPDGCSLLPKVLTHFIYSFNKCAHSTEPPLSAFQKRQVLPLCGKLEGVQRSGVAGWSTKALQRWEDPPERELQQPNQRPRRRSAQTGLSCCFWQSVRTLLPSNFSHTFPPLKNLKSPAQFQLFDIYVDSFMSNGIRIREGQVVNCSSNLSFPSEIIFQSNTNKKTTLCCRTDAEHDWVFFLLLSFSCNQI